MATPDVHSNECALELRAKRFVLGVNISCVDSYVGEFFNVPTLHDQQQEVRNVNRFQTGPRVLRLLHART